MQQSYFTLTQSLILLRSRVSRADHEAQRTSQKSVLVFVIFHTHFVRPVINLHYFRQLLFIYHLCQSESQLLNELATEAATFICIQLPSMFSLLIILSYHHVLCVNVRTQAQDVIRKILHHTVIFHRNFFLRQHVANPHKQLCADQVTKKGTTLD